MPTPAQETITYSMLAAFLACGVTTGIVLWWLGTRDLFAIAFLSLTSFVVSAYLIPHMTAFWLDRPLNDIMVED